MNIQIRYEEQPGITVEDISVLASFCGYDAAKGKMHREGEAWIYEGELPPGEYYYKFLINEAILLNDPMANSYAPRKEEETELWSYLKVNRLGERLYNNTQYTVNVAEYQLSAAVTEGSGTEKHKFSAILDKRVVARFGFNQVTGIHTVTVLWCDYTGAVREYSEQILLPEENPGNPAVLWFWLDLEALKQPEGRWTIKLFIDGKFILEDYFQVGNAFLYSQEGRIKNT